MSKLDIKTIAPGDSSAFVINGSGLQTVAVNCCVCNDAKSSVIAVGEDFEYRTSDDTFNAHCCDGCGLVFLNPRDRYLATRTVVTADISCGKGDEIWETDEEEPGNLCVEKLVLLIPDARERCLGCRV